MDRRKDTALEAVLEQLIEHGPGEMASVFARAFELAMQIERERFLGAGHYERTPERHGYANDYKPKRIDTPAGTVNVQVPKTAGHDGEPFYPQSLERGRRSVRSVMLAVAEMYVKGVSTRDAEAVMREFGIESLSSSQVSRAAKLLDDELEAWRNRPLGQVKYLILDARYEKMRHGGVVRDAAVLSAIGMARTSDGVFWGFPSPCPRPRFTGGASWKAWSPAACAGSSSSCRMITPGCALPGGLFSVGPHGSDASFISRATPSIMRRTPRSASASVSS
jgi:hypothetical protein